MAGSETIETDLAGKMSYTDYLRLDDILSAQSPRSPEHDEPLFIIIHQVKELWLKLFNHELDAAIGFVREDRLPQAFKAMARIGRIQEQLIGAWTVLSTMTPSEYLSFRPYLGPSSGFQSWQYRVLEFKLGAKNAFMMEPHRHRPDLLAAVDAAYRAPGLYDETLRLLARRGYPVPNAVLQRDVTAPYLPDPEVEAMWRDVYRDPATHFEVYELAEELMDMEEAFHVWRFRHMKTVERIIGMRMGTGGSAGVGYLKTALDKYFFPELWSVRTKL